MHIKSLLVLAFAVNVISVNQASSQVLVTYNFEGATGREPTVSGVEASAVTASDFTLVGTNISTSTDTAFVTTNLTANDQGGALAMARYFGFTLTATDAPLKLTTFTIEFGGNATTGNSFTSNILVQSSIGGFGGDKPVLSVTPSDFLVSGSSRTFVTGVVDISGSEFLNLSSIEFQIRFFDNADDANFVDRLNNVSVSAATVPEPAALGLISVFAGIFLIRRSVRRKEALTQG